jgi:hypothetical protein
VPHSFSMSIGLRGREASSLFGFFAVFGRVWDARVRWSELRHRSAPRWRRIRLGMANDAGIVCLSLCICPNGVEELGMEHAPQ